MYKLLNITQNDLRVAFKEPGIWLNLVILPIVLIFIIGLANGGFGNTIPRIKVDVYDNDRSTLSAELLDALRDLDPNLILCPMDNTPDDVCQLSGNELTMEMSQKRVRDFVVNAIIDIPVGFEQALLRGEPTTLIYRSDENFSQPSVIVQTVQAAVSRISGASLAARVSTYALSQANSTDVADADDLVNIFYETARKFWSNPPSRVVYRSTGTVITNSGFAQSVPGMGSMYVMFTVLAGATALLLERKQWTLQRLVMMPVRKWQILGGKLFARFIMGMIQYGVAFGFGMVLGIRLWDNLIGVLALMIGFSLCMTALAFLIATLVKTDMQAVSTTVMLSLVIAPLGGAWWPLEIVPDFMKVVAFATPMGWVMHGYNRLLIYNGGLEDIILPVVVLLSTAAILFGIAVMRFKYE